MRVTRSECRFHEVVSFLSTKGWMLGIRFRCNAEQEGNILIIVLNILRYVKRFRISLEYRIKLYLTITVLTVINCLRRLYV